MGEGKEGDFLWGISRSKDVDGVFQNKIYSKDNFKILQNVSNSK